MRILTVGDDPELKTVIKEKLLRENCMVDSCNSGSAALDYLQLAEYDVVLMDFDATCNCAVTRKVGKPTLFWHRKMLVTW